MKVVEPNIVFEDNLDGEKILKKLEKIGRVCYKSENKITDQSAENFIRAIIERGHESVIEHISVSIRVICDRGVTHEIVRHRIASYSQESTRYCNYSDNKFGEELTFIKPCFWNEDDEKFSIWLETMKYIEDNYLKLIKNGSKAQEARSILPNSLKSEIVITMNLREWRHFLTLRTSKAAHPQMREIANIILTEFKSKIPVIFDDILN
ncbi:FAD-dependent thymidylate synthase [Clostridium sp.]|uniref:FAD-dependent thymidylate synthase n=1 Tax=Clostridium sp. TaxID=1506 RepID=UPI003990D886